MSRVSTQSIRRGRAQADAARPPRPPRPGCVAARQWKREGRSLPPPLLLMSGSARDAPCRPPVSRCSPVEARGTLPAAPPAAHEWKREGHSLPPALNCSPVKAPLKAVELGHVGAAGAAEHLVDGHLSVAQPVKELVPHLYQCSSNTAARHTSPRYCLPELRTAADPRCRWRQPPRSPMRKPSPWAPARPPPGIPPPAGPGSPATPALTRPGYSGAMQEALARPSAMDADPPLPSAGRRGGGRLPGAARARGACLNTP